jgi:uncharacterized membrane protein SirB2
MMFIRQFSRMLRGNPRRTDWSKTPPVVFHSCMLIGITWLLWSHFADNPNSELPKWLVIPVIAYLLMMAVAMGKWLLRR